jgi:hypothetical protein
MFLTNKYTKYYFSIIQTASSQSRKKGTEYFESHHIIPRSLGGTNTKSNLVLLTGREHFICHVLLPKMFDINSNGYNKMLHAIMLFKGSNKYQIRYINSRMYETLKTAYSAIRSKARKDQPLSEEQKQKISDTMKGHKLSDETKTKISDKAKTRKRKPFSDEYKQRQSEIMKQRNRWRDKSLD